MEDGGVKGWYYNWKSCASICPESWESFHNLQVVPWIDSNLNTIANRTGRRYRGPLDGRVGRDPLRGGLAGAPVTDRRMYDTHYTERYLGADPVGRDRPAYERSSLLQDAARLARPLLLIHGVADDNVLAAHTLQLSQRLTESGRIHAVLPLTGITHMTPQEAVAENLLTIQVEFLRQALGMA
jgi:Prolyl oligopeptidase family